MQSVRRALIAAQWIGVALSLYQSVVTVLGLRATVRARPPLTTGGPRFGIIICARNEEAVVGGIVGDLLRQEYPAELVQVLAVAHNCTDGTSDAAEGAGARVVRVNSDKPGKVYAIAAGLRELKDSCDLIGVFDADSRVPDTMLANVAAAAEGEVCLQIEALPMEAHDWAATAYGLGRRARNTFWWRPREGLGLGTTITGAGWFIRPHVLAELLQDPRTLTEDLELTARLYSHGYKVAYVSTTFVRIDEPHSLESSLHQRLRWVRGHFGVVRNEWPGLARRAIRGDLRALDMAIYLLVPTRIITRLGVTMTAAVSLVRPSLTVPRAIIVPALAGEWALPAAIAARQRLVPLSIGGLSMALRHTFLALLWFPIGLWGLVTANVRVWDRTPRASRAEES